MAVAQRAATCAQCKHPLFAEQRHDDEGRIVEMICQQCHEGGPAHEVLAKRRTEIAEAIKREKGKGK